MTPAVIARWIDFVENDSSGGIDDLLAEDAVFYSPAVVTRRKAAPKPQAT